MMTNYLKAEIHLIPLLFWEGRQREWFLQHTDVSETKRENKSDIDFTPEIKISARDTLWHTVIYQHGQKKTCPRKHSIIDPSLSDLLSGRGLKSECGFDLHIYILFLFYHQINGQKYFEALKCEPNSELSKMQISLSISDSLRNARVSCIIQTPATLSDAFPACFYKLSCRELISCV